MRKILPSILSVICAVAAPFVADALEPDVQPANPDLEAMFHSSIRPYLETYCLDCHNPEKQKGDLDLSGYQSLASVAKDFNLWDTVLDAIDHEEMPPEKAKAHPSREVSAHVIAWIKTLRKEEAKRNAGDPGIVLARRLSNAEYNNTIRDLIGFDIRPTREFPVDPANLAGFDNSGESLSISPGLLKKYLEAAREVADHLVLKPDGIAFAAHPVITDTDRDKYAVNRIIDFYKRQRTDFADYFEAAWRYQHRVALGSAASSLDDVADQAKLSRKYLFTIWSLLTGDRDTAGPIAALQILWEQLPAGTLEAPSVARTGCEQMRDFVVNLRGELVPEVRNLTAPGIHNGSQSFVLWKNRQYAANRRRYAGGALTLSHERVPAAAQAALAIPAQPAAVHSYEKTFDRFCSTFPDAFVVSERARVYLDANNEKALGGRLLSAGFHSMMGYFRDDAPLYELMLDASEQQELDSLWRELDFITGAPMRQHTGFVWFERTDSKFLRDREFDFARAEDKDVTSEAKIGKLSALYLAKAKNLGAGDLALEVIGDFFERVSTSIRAVEDARLAAEPSHLRALVRFAERATRRPLTPGDEEDIRSFYRSLKEQEGLSHEDAVRDTLVSILMSPQFCYRVDLVEQGIGIQPLSDYALASRLSYFLWSSLPDDQLLSRAAAGELRRPEILVAEAKRMMRDDRIRGLALEFGANWLGIRRFEEHNAVNRERFTSFNDELRRAMFEEPMRFLVDVVRENRSVLDFLYADHTFVNPALAKHYGIDFPQSGESEWVRVNGLQPTQRGGLLPMAVFLTKNAPGDRTSPVKRGHWVVKNLLGERIPPPPPSVPELVSDEASLGDLTLRETLAKHRQDVNCASCHERIDSIGLVFEGFGPVGELRAKDFAGHAIDTRASFPNGTAGTGVEGLRRYIRDYRQDEFVENLCRKLLTFALNRSLMISDDPLVARMKERLSVDGYRFDNLVDAIVTSSQFLTKRSRTELVNN